MLTIAQVSAILSLLMAFGVGQPTLSLVQSELTVTQAPLQQPPVQSVTPPTVPVFGDIQAPTCDSAPIIESATLLHGVVGNLYQDIPETADNLSVPVDKAINFSVDVPPDCSGQWYVWLDTGGTSTYDNVYGSPSYDANNRITTSALPASTKRTLGYNPTSEGENTLTFYAGNGVATSSVQVQISVGPKDLR